MATTVLDPADQISEPTALSMLKSDSENPMDPSSTGQLKKSTSAFFRRKKKVMAADLLPPLPLGGQAYQGPQSERATPPTEIQRREAHQDFQSKGTDRNRAQQRPEIPTLDRLGAKTMEEHTLHTSTIRAIPQSPAVPQFHERSLDPYNRHIAHVSQKANQARPRVKHRPRTSPAGPTAISIPDHESSDNPGQGEIVRVAPRTTSVGKTNKLSNAISLDRLNERLLIHDPDSVMRSRRENASTSKPLRESQLLREKVSDSKHEAGEANGQSQTQNRDLASISDDWDRAQLIYDGKEGSIPKDRLAAWLGDNDPVSARTLTTYMKLFNLSALNILTALRVLCSKLILRGETQQVDRILSAFSERWFQCNAQNGFIHQDIVHTLCYSILLLNTDLHVAEIPFSQKMTRNQFVKNTLATVRAVRSRLEHPEEASSEDRSDAHKNQDLNDPAVTKLPPSSFHTRASDGAVAEGRPSMESIRSVRRQSQSLPPDSEPLVSAPSIGSVKVWEQQIDRILRDFYASIRSSALPLHDGEANTDLIDYECDAGRLLLRSQVLPKRTMSVLSKSTTDSGQPISKGDNRTLGSKWVHRHRPRPRLYPMSTGGSSRTSFDDGESPMWSPNESSTWSKHSLVKTGTSVSVDSLGPQTQKPAYGFASSLNNAMHREDSSPLATDQPSPALIEDRLELAGAPWAKEGLLKHKHILEAVNKKARHRAWLECFVVVQRGWLRLFSFHNKASTTRSITDGVVGGGNWLQNASPIDSFALRHSYAFTMPLGISKDRPHTWTLYLASGATHLFQAGTEEVAREFVLTTNYWSARSSREPLAGGISNLEYGWSSNVLKPIDRSVAPAPEARATGSSSSKHSHQDVGAAPLPGDSVMISTWVVPNQSTLSSVLTETEQLENLAKHVKAVDLELRQHSEIRPRLILSYSSRHPNLIKALTNWERRNVYLKRECNRQRLYLDAIRQAIKEREAIDEKKEKTVAA